MRYRNEPGSSDITDYFKFSTSSYLGLEAAFNFPPGGGTGIFPQQTNQFYDIFSANVQHCLAPDTFYIRVYTSTFGPCGTYFYDIKSRSFGLSEPENNDSVHLSIPINDSSAMEALIGFNSWDKSGTQITDQVDFFEIVTKETGKLEITIQQDSMNYSESGNLNIPILKFVNSPTVYSSTTWQKLPVQLSGSLQSYSPVTLTLDCAKPDTFFLKVQSQSGCGKYNVKYKIIQDTTTWNLSPSLEEEPNDFISQAQSIDSLSFLGASLGHRYYSNYPNYEIDTADFYQFYNYHEGPITVKVATTFPHVSNRLELINSSGILLSYDNGPSDTLEIFFRCGSEGSYYIKYRSDVCQSYSVWHEIEKLAIPGFEPNNSFSTATKLDVKNLPLSNSTIGYYQSTLQYVDTVDFYKLITTAGEQELYVYFDDKNVSATLNIYKDTTTLYQSYILTDSLSFIYLGCLEADEFYVELRSGDLNCYDYEIGILLNAPLIFDMEPNNYFSHALTASFAPVPKYVHGYLGGEKISSFEPGDYRDYYKLISNKPGGLAITVLLQDTAYNTTVTATLFSRDSVTILASDTLSNDSATFILPCSQADSFYLLIEQMIIGQECDEYKIILEQEDTTASSFLDQEPNDSIKAAVSLMDLTVNSFTLGYIDYGNISLRDEIDYVFIAPGGDDNFDISLYLSENLKDVTVRFLTAKNQIIKDTNLISGDTIKAYIDCWQDTIYISVSALDGCGSYYIYYEGFNYTEFHNDQENNDDAANSLPASGGILRGHLGHYSSEKGGYDESDYYNFNLSDFGTLKLYLTVDSNFIDPLVLELRDNQDQLVETKTVWSNNIDSLIFDCLAPTDIYLQVKRSGQSCGNYKLEIAQDVQSYTNDQEPNDNDATALALPINGTVEGTTNFEYLNPTAPIGYDVIDNFYYQHSKAAKVEVKYNIQPWNGEAQIIVEPPFGPYKFNQPVVNSGTFYFNYDDPSTKYYLRIFSEPGNLPWDCRGYNLTVSSTPTGIKDLKNPLPVIIYPNPSEGNLIVELGEEQQLQLKVVDLTGRQIMEQQIKELKNFIRLKVPKGIYLLIFTNKKGERFYKKVVVE